MDFDMDDAYFKAVQPTPPLDEQTLQSLPRISQMTPESAPHRRSRRPPIHHINLTGFTSKLGDPEYAAAAKATGTKGNEPVYWFKEYRSNNDGSYDDLASIMKVQKMMQVDRDAVLYSHATKRQLETPTKNKSRDKPVVSSLRNKEKRKGTAKKVQFVEQAVEVGNNQYLNESSEEGDGCDKAQAEADETPGWISFF